jgi:ABC-type multidrug transport system, ATPase component
VCDVVMIINKGKLIVSDTPDNLSKHMEGSNGIELKIKGTEDQVKQALEHMDGVTDLKFKESQSEDLVSVTVYSNDKNDVRETLFYRLADAKCPIYEMRTITMSLEEIFLEVTQSDNSKEAAEAKEEADLEEKAEVQKAEIQEVNEEEVNESEEIKDNEVAAEKEDE